MTPLRLAVWLRRTSAIFLLLASVGAAGLAAATATAASPERGEVPAPAQQQDCLGCHGNPGMSVPLASGEVLDVSVNAQEMAGSVHGGLVCTDCHQGITGFPHAPISAKTRRDYALAMADSCQRCHLGQYTKTLDSLHYGGRQQGNPGVPVCTDCHGFHAVASPGAAPYPVAAQCAQCHAQIYADYAKSVHGTPLPADRQMDVPVCTSCHQVHTSETFDRARLRSEIPRMCARCHADKQLMDRYGIKSNVYETYSRDFHGVTLNLARETNSDEPVAVAVCTDCHGVHDIQRMAGTTQQVRQRALAMCQQCHPGASSSFPDAWLGHYEITFQNSPLVWLVRAFYWVLIPFMLVGLALHIGMDLWVAVRNR